MILNDSKRIDLSKPRYDQTEYWGRAKHFFTIANPLNILASNAQLEQSKEIVTKYKAGHDMSHLTEDEIWQAKNLYDSAFHPETGEKMFILGRMSFQAPGNMLITGCMLQFYKSTPAVIFWQWINQTFNAIVNYTNRSGDSQITNTTLATVYFAATTGAVGTALFVNSMSKKMPPIVGRFGPFIAVAAANCINIPLMRSNEIKNGLSVTTNDNKPVGDSSNAAKTAIAQVALSRILMAVPGMTIPPIIMNHLEKKGFLARYPYFGAPFQIAFCGFLLIFATPMCCALFPQRSSILLNKLEPEIVNAGIELGLDPKKDVLYYNKGL